MFSDRSRLVILLGFSLVMALMAAVLFVAHQQLTDNNRSMETIVNKHNAKTGYIITMYVAARERSISVLRMINMEDPFDRDEESLYFNQLATHFAVARIELSKLQFDKEEKKFYDEQFRLTEEAVPLLNGVVDLLIEDKLEEANRLFIERAIPAQNLVLEQLSRMLEYQREAAQKSLHEANLSYNRSIIKIALLALGAFIIGLSIVWFIIRYVSRADQALFAQVTLESIGDAVITTDANANINYLNSLAEKMTGWSYKKAKGKTITDVFNLSEDGKIKDFNSYMHDVSSEEESLNIINKAVLIDAEGDAIDIDFTVSSILDEDHKRIGTALAFRNVSKERELRRQLSFQACHDALTGLINRYEFEKRLEQLISSCSEDDSVHAFFYLDLDEFKVVNDTCGHIAGDELLRQLSSLLHLQVRGHDTIARLGGDEFGILLENCDAEKSVELATKILHTIQEFQFAWEGNTFKVGASIGVIEINRHSRDIANVMANADTACYSAKDSGRNRVHVATEGDEEIASRRGEMQWVSVISKALNENSFELHYQSVRKLTKNNSQPFGIEILLRMKGEDGELIPPGAFIPAAERYNLMTQLDRWVVMNSLQWLSENTEVTKHINKCAINLSGQTIGEDSFLDFVKQQLLHFRIDPKKICFEITETAAISNLSKAGKFITELKHMGCFFALDDFGSGLSSFAYLKNLPIDYIKIDGMFVRDIASDPIDLEMVRSITVIARAMGKQTIAEFVENDEIKDILRDIGVDYVQGYGIAKPDQLTRLTAAELEATE